MDYLMPTDCSKCRKGQKLGSGGVVMLGDFNAPIVSPWSKGRGKFDKP